MSNEKVLTEEEKAYLEWVLEEHKRKLRNFESLNSIVNKNEIVFVGDSITEGFPIRDIISDKGIIYNRGISGFKAYQLEENMDTVVLNIKPKKIVFLIGTNDIADGRSVDEIVLSIKNILEQTKESLPISEVFICGILPVNEAKKFSEGVYIRTNQIIKEINKKVKNHVQNNNYLTYLDTFEWMLEDGNLKEEYTYDGLHLSIVGYVRLSKLLKKYL